MNHTLYFKDDHLFLEFKEKAKQKGSMSDALSEALQLWLLHKNRGWPEELLNMKPVIDDYRIESGRTDLHFEEKDYF
ncbi:MAG: hypothetical protein NTW94_06190 [Legionellales bacterium]|nr:hypothetical protein [Legionellales bacterium]